MPSFGRIGKQSNRSQHNLVDTVPALSALATNAPVGASGLSSANNSASSALSCGESFQHIDQRTAQQQHQQLLLRIQQKRQQQHQQELQTQQSPGSSQQQTFGGNIPTNNSQGVPFASLPSINPTASPQQNRTQQDFAVSRAQSTRYPVSPLQTQQQFGPASSSVDDLSQTIHSPIVNQQKIQQQTGLSGPQTAAPSPETKRSARKLIKNILSATSTSRSSDQSYHQHHNSYDNTSRLARRPSKRLSNPFPPSIRTGTSQVSLEQQQQQSEWTSLQAQQQQQQQQQLSLQGAGGTDESYKKEKLMNQELHAQKPHNSQAPRPHQNTIRQVPIDIDPSPYSLEDVCQQQRAQFQQAQAQLQAQTRTEKQQQQLGYPTSYCSGYPSGTSVAIPHQQGQVYLNHPGANSQQPNPETVSQLSYDSPVTDSDNRSAQTSPAATFPQHDLPGHQVQPPVSPLPSTSQLANMPPPPGGPGAVRRTGDNEKNMRGAGNVEPPPGPPPSYRHSQGPMNNMNTLPPTPSTGGNHNANYRASSVPERQLEVSGEATGRNSPQPSTGGERDATDPDKQFKDLLTKYKNVKRLYFDGKTQIEQLTNQVEQLQNAVANQRISQSRTSLDDSEYTTRFNRLNGAINNLAFNIRKDWRLLPGWIDRYVSPEALKTGKQEMTAVGRAVIVRWVVDEIFSKCFHPGLDVDLSRYLKEIEMNIRKFSYTLSSQEEYDALTSKVVNWRMATLEGLQHALQSPESTDHRNDFTNMSASNLTAHLYQYLVDPPPAGVDGSVAMIVELAVGIATSLPLESRDVAVTYPLPGDSIETEFMELEKAGLPALPDTEDTEDGGKDGDKASKREKTKSGMLSMLGGAQPPGSRKGSVVSNTDAPDPTATLLKDPTKIRFAGFVAVEVRGRQVLVKAPVWSLG